MNVSLFMGSWHLSSGVRALLLVSPFVANSIGRFLSWVFVHRSIHLLLGKQSAPGV